MESTGKQITLRPVRGLGSLTKEHGVWVFYTGQRLPSSATDEMPEQIRELWASAALGIVGGGIYDAMLAHCAIKVQAYYALCGRK